MSKTYSDVSNMESCDENGSVKSKSSTKKGKNRKSNLNPDENQLELMKKVLKKERRKSKSSTRKSSGSGRNSILNQAFSFGIEDESESGNIVNNNNNTDDLISIQSDVSTSAKKDAFQMLMSRSKCSDQDSTPETSIKLRKKYTKKPKYLSLDEDLDGGDITKVNKNIESNIDKRILLAKDVEASDENIVKLIPKQSVKHYNVKNDLNKKRKIEEVDKKVQENPKKQKIKKMIKNSLDAVESSDNKEPINNYVSPERTANAISWSSGRPKRSCSAKVPDYSMLLSPEKQTPPAPCDTPKRRGVYRSKKEIAIEECLTLTVNDSEEEEENNGKINQPETKVILAPLFMKKALKPQVDPMDVKARRNFLLSGIPDEMRCEINKRQQFEEQILSNVDLIAFPLIAHVTQLHSNNLPLNDVNLWSKSKVKIRPIEVTNEINSNMSITLKYGVLTNCNINADDVQVKCNKMTSIKSIAIDDVKLILRQLKVENETFPYNRCYKQLLKMKNSASEKSEKELSDCTLITTITAPFVEIYKPKMFMDYIFGIKHVKLLQEWLLEWNEKNDIEMSDSDSDFGGSRHSTASKVSNNYIVLCGAQSTGKSSSVYALANDLNYKVIEINAGSKRTGKKLLQDLQEATQSHRINKNKLFSSNEEQKSCSQDTNVAEKTLILIEDADIVFEDIDDGFVNSLQQLINISKRPVIMTSNSRNCPHLLKYIQNNSIDYVNNNLRIITEYLRIMCLVENFNIETNHISNLLTINNYDLRKTIMELEFFIKSHNTIIDKNRLFEMHIIKRRKNQRHAWHNAKINYNKTMNVNALQFHTDTASKLRQICNKIPTDENSYQQHCLTDEIAHYLEQTDILLLNDVFSRKEKPIR